MNTDLFQYLAELMPAALMQCSYCVRQVEVSKAIEKDKKHYCSERCADIATAPMIRPQPKGVTVDGWDI